MKRISKTIGILLIAIVCISAALSVAAHLQMVLAEYDDMFGK